jgi:hypothetical protein
LLVVELTVFDPAEAKLKRKPYAVRLHTSDSTAEQLVTGITLLGILGDRLSKMTNERYPGAIQSFLRGDEVLKYGRGEVTGVEDAEGQRADLDPDYMAVGPDNEIVPRPKDEDAPSRRPAGR